MKILAISLGAIDDSSPSVKSYIRNHTMRCYIYKQELHEMASKDWSYI